jgi:hypothetical protein
VQATQKSSRHHTVFLRFLKKTQKNYGEMRSFTLFFYWLFFLDVLQFSVPLSFEQEGMAFLVCLFAFEPP